MKQTIELTQEASDALLTNGRVIATKESTYCYFPYWLRLTDKEGVFELLRWDELPNDLTSAINLLRVQESIPKQQ